MALVQRGTDNSTKVDRMIADSQVQIGERLRLVGEQSRNARLMVQRRALALVPKAIQTLEQIMLDDEAPSQTRRLCALDILSLGRANPGEGGESGAANKPLHEMTADDLRAMLDTQRKAVEVLEQGLVGDVFEGSPVTA